jgi:hypothetical protein
MKRTLLLVMLLTTTAGAQTEHQPKVQPGPMEPDWDVILDQMYGLRMFDDLLNPVKSTPEATPGLFKKAGAGKVTFRPVIALGLPAVIRGGTYTTSKDKPDSVESKELWSYQYRNTADDIAKGTNLPPPLAADAKTEFDPGAEPFGLFIANDQFKDAVYSEPRRVKSQNPRLAKQPYKAMIYPFKDKKTGKVIPHSFLIGWEYSTNDDFQDVVCRIDNVDLLDVDGKAVKVP